MGSRKYHDEAWLREKYHDERMTMAEIGEECGVTNTTISDWLDRHGIEKRDRREAQRPSGKHTNREWLAKQYHGMERSLSDIADECGVDPVTIMNWMERHNIPRRESTDHQWVSRVTRAQVEGGYIRLSCRVPDSDAPEYAFEHQLVAIADGADPHKVFSDGDYQCHHKNGVPWDNRPENVEVLSATDHATEHLPERVRAATGEFL